MKPLFLRNVILVLALMLFASGAAAQSPLPKMTSEFKDGITTVRMEPLKISGPKNEYHSLHVAASFTYPGDQPQFPKEILFEIQSIVKRHTLNSDLYIVFLIEDDTVFLSSTSRSAVKNPYPGRRMIGERIKMKMPLKTYLRLASAKRAAIKMGGTVFELSSDHKAAFAELTKRFDAAS